MIEYDPGKWQLALIFQCYGSVFPKAFFWAFPSTVASCCVFFFVDVPPNEHVSQIWTSYMFVLGFLIVFRSQQAYAKMWEGATLLGQVRGEWFNAVSSLFAFCTERPDKKHEVQIFQNLVARLMSLLFCTALQDVAHMEDEAFEILDFAGVAPESMQFLMERGTARCEIILQWLQRLICINIGTGVLPIPAPILSRVFQELSRGIVVVNNAKKISEIPFPFPYAQMVSVMLMIMALVTPFVAGMLMGNIIWAGGLTFVSVFAFASINYIAAEIELPFGDDPNDLPVAELQRTMNRYLLVLLEEKTQRPPRFTPVASLDKPCELIKMHEDTVYKKIRKSRLDAQEAAPSQGKGDLPKLPPAVDPFDPEEQQTPTMGSAVARGGMAAVVEQSSPPAALPMAGARTPPQELDLLGLPNFGGAAAGTATPVLPAVPTVLPAVPTVLPAVPPVLPAVPPVLVAPVGPAGAAPHGVLPAESKLLQRPPQTPRSPRTPPIAAGNAAQSATATVEFSVRLNAHTAMSRNGHEAPGATSAGTALQDHHWPTGPPSPSRRMQPRVAYDQLSDYVGSNLTQPHSAADPSPQLRL